MRTVLRFIPLFLCLLVFAPQLSQAALPQSGPAATVDAQVTTTRAPHAQPASTQPLRYASGDVVDPGMYPKEEEPVTKPKTALKTYILWGSIAAIVIFLIWFFIRPFIQGLMGKGPQKTEKKE